MPTSSSNNGPKIEDVARLANVSTATVSRALRGLPNVSPATVEKVLSAAEELHYVIDPQASRLAAGHTMTIAVVVPMIDQWFYNKILTNAEVTLFGKGYDTIRFSMVSLKSRTAFLKQLASRKRVDGIIIVTVPMTPEDIDILKTSNVPVVTIETKTNHFPSITIDNTEAIFNATQHLIDLGHDKIAIISGLENDPLIFHVPIPHERKQGYVRALQSNNLEIREQYIESGEFSYAGGYEATQKLLRLPLPPTAILAFSDEMAIGALKAAKDMGYKIPTDLSIIGFDDQDVSPYLGLTTIYQPVAQFGKTAAHLLLQLIEGTDVSSVILQSELRIRATTNRRSTS